MFPVRYDPFRELRELEKEFFPRVNSLFKESDNLSAFKPAVNTREGEYAYHIEVDLPGVDKDGIKVDVSDKTLTISGERRTKNEVNEKDYYRCESAYGKFQRSFTLPDNVDTENVTASCEDGVLEVVIPKLEKEGEKKQIEVK